VGPYSLDVYIAEGWIEIIQVNWKLRRCYVRLHRQPILNIELNAL